MMPAVAKAPAATAIQTRSKTIQSPQAQVSERCVEPPRPRANRATNERRAERHQRGEQEVRGRPELRLDRGELHVVLGVVLALPGAAAAASAFATAVRRCPRA